MRRAIVCIMIAAVLVAGVWGVLSRNRSGPDEFMRAMNVGKGHIENRESAQAIEVLTRAVALRPNSTAALRNLARAYLIPKRAEDCLKALELLDRARPIDPDSPATAYLTGLALVGLERYTEAVPCFEEAVRLDPNTAALRYQLATALATIGEHDRAYEQLTETTRLEPLHTNAIYKLASHARRRGDREEVMRLTREFQRLKEAFGLQPDDFFQRCVHLNPESALEDATLPARATRSAPAAQGVAVRFRDVSDAVAPADGQDRSATTAAVLEVDKEGTVSWFVASADGEMSVMRMSSGGRFDRTVVRGAPQDAAPREGQPPRFTTCAVGDFFIRIPDRGPDKFTPRHHARNDVFLLGANAALLLERTPDGTFHDRTVDAGLAALTGRRARWIDYDHNGVLDLFVARESGLELWQNNSYVVRIESTGGAGDTPPPPRQQEGGEGGASGTGDSEDAILAPDGVPSDDIRFVQVTEQVGLTATGSATDVAPIEVDDNGAIDVVVARGSQPTKVFVNQRAGRFAPMVEPPGPWPEAIRVLTDDLNNDGHIDAVLVGEDHALILHGGPGGRRQIDYPDLGAHGGTLVDYDNDGWLDLCVYGSQRDAQGQGGLRFWRNEGSRGWTDATTATGADGLSLPEVREALPADTDNDGDTDLLLLTGDDRWRLLQNDGGNANRQLKLRLVSILTNPTGLGDRIELRRGDLWLTRLVSRLPIEIGVGTAEQLDTVTTLWTNGVMDNEFLVSPTRQPLEFVEKMVELGSCPFLFAWDGERFRFVTDILGNSPLGLSIRRGEVLPADPDEIVYVGDADKLAVRDGAYWLEVAECYREVLYLDAAKLIAVDHAPVVEIHPTDKLMPPPFPVSELWALDRLRPSLRVESDDGVERTSAVAAWDEVYAPPGPTLPPPFRGLCQPLTLTMDFGPIDASASLVLALTGWRRYGSASVNIAVAQNPALTVIPPTLEAETESGVWQPVDVVVGMPAGKTKTIVCDLTGTLPPRVRRLRLTSTFEIRWDRIALGTHAPLDQSHVHALSPDAAEIHWRGFPEMKPRGTGHPITPDHNALSDRPAWRATPQGWCTRYGDVIELVAQRDDRYVIVNGGDAVTLRFSADALPPVPEGLTRSFFFYSVGWEKDGDYNVVTGDTVEPLPQSDGSAGPTDDAWRLQYNTRWVPRDIPAAD